MDLRKPLALATSLVVGAAGLSLIHSEEGLRLRPYKDAVGKWTWCYGDTKHVRFNRPATVQECDAILEQDMRDEWKLIAPCLKQPYNRNQKDALVSLGLNIGGRRVCTSSVVRYHNQDLPIAAANSFRLWGNITVNGKLHPVKRLQKRRDKEALLYSTPVTNETDASNTALIKAMSVM